VHSLYLWRLHQLYYLAWKPSWQNPFDLPKIGLIEKTKEEGIEGAVGLSAVYTGSEKSDMARAFGLHKLTVARVERNSASSIGYRLSAFYRQVMCDERHRLSNKIKSVISIKEYINFFIFN
jgi:hypothetical protein